MKVKEYIKEFLFLCACSLLFLYPAFLNGYPLVTSDTGTYISSGIYLEVPADRPIMYGIFLRHSSLKESLWLSVFAQGLILSWILSQVIKQFLPRYSGRVHRLVIFLLLALFTPVSWFCSQLMADFFTPIAILSLGLIFFSPGQDNFQKVLTIIIFYVSTLTHNSHLLDVTLSFIVFAIISFILPLLFRSKKSEVPVRKFWLSFVLVFSCWFLSPTINYLCDGKFRLSGSAHVFLVARMAENGMLQDYLKKECSCKAPLKLSDSVKYIIITKNSAKVLEIGEGQMADNTSLHQWSFVDGKNQKFYLEHVKDDFYKIRNAQSKKVISSVPGSPIALAQFSDSNGVGQIFKISETKDHFFSISYPETGQVFESNESIEKDGALITLGQNKNLDYQQFRIFPDTSWKLCIYQDQIPNSTIEFIWSERSLLWKTGGWENSKKEYESIIRGIYLNPKYFTWNLREAITSTGRQLVHIDLGDGIFKYELNSPPGGNILSHFSRDVNSFTSSLQYRSYYNFVDVNKKVLAGFIISLIIFSIFFSNRRNKDQQPMLWYFSSFCFIAIILNAFVTGALANVIDRLQSRIIVIIPLCALLMIYEPVLIFIKRKISGKEN